MKIQVVKTDMLDEIYGIKLNDVLDVIKVDEDGFYIVTAPTFDEYPLHPKQVKEI